LLKILLSVAVRLSLCAPGSANVKKQASPAQLFAIAMENVHELSYIERKAIFIHKCEEFNFSGFNFCWH